MPVPANNFGACGKLPTTTTNMKIVCTVYLLVMLVLHGVAVEGRPRRHQQQHREIMLFIFGDSFVDAGGQPPANEISPLTRAWHYPYGISSSQGSTGRFSDGMVQSDLLAKMLGRDESPPAYRVQTAPVDPSGVNFAVGGSGVLDGKGTSLPRQMDQFISMLDYDIIDKKKLNGSVALLSISAGHDYYPHMTHDHDNNPDRMRVLSGQVTDKITATVKRLHDRGVKVLVNLMPPIGCNPWQSVASNYSSCEGHGNALANIHNEALRQKLHGSQDVLLLDLYAVFTSELSSLVPCCRSLHHNAYCGEIDGNGRQTYSLCNFRRDYIGDFFFWDQIHPTEYTWERIMGSLRNSIEEFLAIESSW